MQDGVRMALAHEFVHFIRPHRPPANPLLIGGFSDGEAPQRV